MTLTDYSIIAAGALLLIFLGWKEIRRSQPARLGMRVVFSIIAVVSLLALGLPMLQQDESSRSLADRDGILLSRGFDVDSVNRFVSQNKSTAKIFALLPGREHLVFKGHVTNYVTALSLPDSIGDAREVHLFGYGMPSERLKQIDRKIIFHPSSIPAGFISVDWSKYLQVGEALQIQGQFRNPLKTAVKLQLRGFGSILDSIIIPAGGEATPFYLRALPAQIGRALFDLVAVAVTDTIASESIPFTVQAIKPMRLLLLFSAPGFESRFLKNWLLKNKYGVIARTYISKNKYQREYLNTGAVPFERITQPMLDSADLVIADGQELSTMPAGELAMIRLQVKTRGMGLLVLADSLLENNRFYAEPFPLHGGPVTTNRVTTLNWPGGSRALRAGVNPYIVQKAGMQPLASNTSGHVFAGSALYGFGRIALTTIDDTFSWALDRDNAAYAGFWSLLIGETARRSAPGKHAISLPLTSIVHEENPVVVRAMDAALPQFEIDSAQLSFAQDMWMPFNYTARFWPRHTGWQWARSASMDTSWFFVHPENAWQALRAVRLVNETSRFLSGHNTAAPKKENGLPASGRLVVPRWVLFSCFILSCGYLWAEKKYTGVL